MKLKQKNQFIMIKDNSKTIEQEIESSQLRLSSPSPSTPTNTIIIFTLLNTSFGPGMLTLPHAIANFGVIPGVLMIIIGAGNMYLSLRLFSDLLMYVKPADYASLGEIIMGSRMKKLISAIFIVYGCGCLIGYSVVISQILNSMFRYFFGLNQENFWLQLLCFFIESLIIFPFSLFENTAKLRR